MSDPVDALHAARPVAVEVARFVPARRGSRELATRMDSAFAAIHAQNSSAALGAVATASRGIADDLALVSSCRSRRSA